MSLWQNIHEADQQVSLFINSMHCGLSDSIMVFFSKIPVWIPLYVAVVAFLFIRLGWKKALVITAAAALTFGLCDQFSNLIKEAVGRLRPCNDDLMISSGLRILEAKSSSFSFFSAHAANSFGFAVTTLRGFRNDKRLRYRGYAAGIFFWAVMVSISRVFVGKHYLGDVIAGAIIGAALGLLVSLMAEFFIRRISQK